jgi:hypothetical protein
MRSTLYRSVALIAAMSVVVPPPGYAQTAPAPAGDTVTAFNLEQLDALLAPIALYPDALLAQTLMAATFPLEVVAASRWLEDPANKSLTGDALARALAKQSWDPSVKSLVPFPQVLTMLNSKLDWMQQLGYAFATQQADVMKSVQRLREQAQAAGYLKTTEQQRVVVEKTTIIIEPASPQTVYVPVYSPTVVYGAWPYPAYPPIYIPPPPGYVVGNAFLAGMAFATGVAVVGSLWGWARPAWYGGSVNVNVNHYNSINVNRPPINSPVWRPPAGGGAGGRPIRPPGGPVGAPGRPTPLPANGIGRPNVQVPGSAVKRPAVGGPAQGGNTQRPGGAQPAGPGGQRPGSPTQLPAQGGNTQRPGSPTQPAGPGGQRPGGPAQLPAQGGNTQRPGGAQPGGAGQRPGSGGAGINRPPTTAQRPAGAFGGMNDGARAGQFGNRGAQSRATQGNAGGGGGAPKQAAQPRGGNANGGARAGNRDR